MYYNIDDIMKYVKNFHLYNGCFTEKHVEDFIYKIDTSVETDNEYTYEIGASKLVIIPVETDYVIKIPFNGYYDYSFNEEEEKLDDLEEFISFYGGGGQWDDDYCGLEEEMYNNMIPVDYKSFFLPVKKVCEVDGYPIYIQSKSNIFGMHRSNCVKDRSKYYSRESLTAVKNSKKRLQTCLPDEWLASCLEYFEGKMFALECFLTYLKDSGIYRDLHTGNIGYYNNKPVIIDYAGFHD